MVETVNSQDLLLSGVLLLLGWFAHALARFAHVPRVTILLMVGVIAGPAVLNAIPAQLASWFPLVTHLALAMVGFLLGENLVGQGFKKSSRAVLYVSIAETLGATLAVFLAVLLLSGNTVLAILLAGIAPATDAAATLDVVRENQARGPLTNTLLGVVAIDDAWGVIVFSLLLVVAETLSGHNVNFAEFVAGFREIFGAIMVGLLMGLPMAWLTGRIKRGEPSILEAMGFVLICGGLALYLNVSYLLACIVLGATVARFAKHHTRPFRDIEGASEPFMVMFFLLAGYKCDPVVLQALGILSIVYMLARSLGLIVGGALGARVANAPGEVRLRIGWCLLPQAGVALGLALLACERVPALTDTVLPLIIGTTVVFEICGPIITRRQLRKSGEA